MKGWTRRMRRLEAWVAAVMLRWRGVAAAIGLFALAGFVILAELKYFQDVFKDNAEAFAWGRQFLGGYGRHPPLTGWIAGAWYGVLPASDAASHALSRLMTLIALAGAQRSAAAGALFGVLAAAGGADHLRGRARARRDRARRPAA